VRSRVVGSALVLALAPGALSFAQGAYGRPAPAPILRWSGAAEWEYVQSDGSLGATENTTRSFGQRYSLDLDTFLWNPRFSRLSLGLDLLRADVDNEGNGGIDSDSLGYRLQTTLFPGRPLSVNAFARRSDIDVADDTVSGRTRETDVWGLDGRLRTSASQNFRVLYERSRSDLLGVLPQQERRSTGMFNFDQEFESGELAFDYRLHEQAERVTGVEFTRQDFTLRELNRFENGTSLRVLATRGHSQGLFSSGNVDELTTNRLSTALDIPRGLRAHFRIAYDFSQSEGKFLDNANHGLRGQSRFRFAEHWHATASVDVARLRSSNSTAEQERVRRGVTSGLRYSREWSRFRLGAAYSIGYALEDFETREDQRFTSHKADLSWRVRVGAASDIFSSYGITRSDNDVTDVGYTFDEDRATLGWEVRLGAALRFRMVGSYRDVTYDTLNFGLQASEQVGIEGSLSHPLAGVTVAYRSTEGVSDFFPDPGGVSIFRPGTDLVSKMDLASLSAYWRVTPHLRVRASGVLDDREFTTTGEEQILSYHAEMQYDRRTWRIAAGLSHYERADGFEYLDDTWRLRVTKLFY
jgi:hypothetical protein